MRVIINKSDTKDIKDNYCFKDMNDERDLSKTKEANF